MAIAPKPDMRPGNPNFSSGPCAKRPGFALDALSGPMLGAVIHSYPPAIGVCLSQPASAMKRQASKRDGIVANPNTDASPAGR